MSHHASARFIGPQDLRLKPVVLCLPLCVPPVVGVPGDRERLALQQLLSEAGSLPDDLRVELLKTIGSKLQAQLQQQQANSQNKNHARRPSVTGTSALIPAYTDRPSRSRLF